MNAQNKHSHLALPTLRTHDKVKKGYFVITLESFTNSILSKQRFSFLRKFKLCIKKKWFLWSCQCKITERHDPRRWAAILSMPVGISLLTPCCKRGNTTKPEMGATSIWHPPCSGDSITNWRCKTHPSILLGQTGILRSLHWRSVNHLYKNNLLSKTKVHFSSQWNKVFLDLQIENKLESLSLQITQGIS